VEPDFVRVYEAVLAALKQRNLHLRASQLRQAAMRIAETGSPGSDELILAGFYSFTAPEQQVIRALAGRVKLTVALAEWAGAQPTLEALSSLATSTEVLSAAPATDNRVLFVAPTLDTEVAEIARRIVQAHDNGRPWREMGVLVRSEANYVPALRSAFHRFGIPSRFYFSSPLADAPAVRYLRAIMNALLSGWDHMATLRALRLPGSRIEVGATGDLFEFEVLKRAPGAGLDGLRSFAEVDDLNALTPWMNGKAFPSTWASRMRMLRSFFRTADLQDRCTHETALLWRAHAAALDGFESACDDAASVLDPAAPIDARQFWNAAETVLASSELRVPDHRRDVVHVIDAFEARQWSLPVVFVCGLLEKEFPKYQTEDAILPDAIRRRMQAQGVQVRTSVQRQSDERFLFDLAITRAREALILSYPQLNTKGEGNLPSFFLQHAKPYTEQAAADVRPTPSRARSAEPAPLILTETARQQLLARHPRFSPTGIETYLQCPYQFFAERTLHLQGTPEKPWERLSMMVQGNIVHRSLETARREHRRVADVFEQVFAEYCLEAFVPEGYRTEAIRLELLHNLEMLEADEKLGRGVQSFYEEPFSVYLQDGTLLKGKIDRIEVDASGAATVIDYKYRSKNGVEKTKKGHEEQKFVQGGLYLLGAESLGYRPAGMVYIGLRREVTFAGWMLAPHYPEVKQACDPGTLQQVMHKARQDSEQAIASIREGRIAPLPADETRCDYCSVAHACRYEVAAMQKLTTLTVGASE
jgi:ATP-dependent helicase/DNAse subunit B